MPDAFAEGETGRRRERDRPPPRDGEILPPLGETVDAEDERRVRDGFWRTMRKAARQLPFAEEVVAAYFCALDPAVPARVRAVLTAALAYFVMPLDAVPDVLPLIGFSDDVTVLTGAINLVVAHICDDHRRAARDALADRAPGQPAGETLDAG